MKIFIILSMLLISQMVYSQQKQANSEAVRSGASNYTLSKHVISSGGGVMSGNSGAYRVTGVIGQIDAGHNADGANAGSITVFQGGFLHGAMAVSLGDPIFKNGFE